ncbi:MAG: hypothetical protein AB1768_09970 [Pseudomonadota bacterium]
MTGICPPACSRPERRLLGAAALILLGAGAPLAAPDISLHIESLSHPLFSASGLTLRLASVGREGPAELRIARLRAADLEFRDVKLRCTALHWSAARFDCPSGELIAAGPHQETLSLRFSYAPQARSLEVILQPTPGESWAVRATPRGADIALRNAELRRLHRFLPALADAGVSGRVDGYASWRDAGGNAAMKADLSLTRLSFSDAAGEHAGEKITGRVVAEARQRGSGWQWRTELRWDAGEAYLKPFYLASGGHRLEASGRLEPQRLTVAAGRLELAGIGAATLSGEWDRSASRLVRGRCDTDEIDLARAAPVFLKPLLEQRALPGVTLAGRLRAVVTWEGEGLSRLDLRLSGVSLTESGGRFGLRGVTADIPWRRDQATQAEVRVAGGNFGRVPLGAFSLPLRMHGLAFDVPKAEIPFLDGAVLIEGLHVARRGGEWAGRVGGALYPVSMRRLTEALGLPSMAGSMSASIPSVRYGGSTLWLDGALIIQVFDGYVAVDNLRVVDPLGSVPRLHADAEARHIDLGQLTETFSFGSITGYVDATVRGLELIGRWPESFSARIESSPGDYRKRISQRAVQNISALGGAGGAAAIQRSFLRFFEEFGYSKLGLSCVLQAGVCEMGGVEPAPQGYVIVKGGGVPAISVIGYNRRVDWDELVARLQRITAGNKPIIE